MAVDENATVKADLVAQSVDFTEQFTANVQTLLQILGKTRVTTLPLGSTIQTYKSEVTKVDGAVGENELIPLSKVTRKKADAYQLEFNKWRKLVSVEAIQSVGFVPAVTDTDNKLRREIQTDLKSKLFAQLAKGTGKASGTGFQGAVANALGQLAVLFEDTDVQTVVFANPLDFYKYLGNTNVTVQTAFGLQYIENFLGMGTVIFSGSVPEGTVYATVADNLNVYAASLNGGSVGQAFNYVTDETGLIGINHEVVNNTASYQTVILSALAMFAERLDGIMVTTIEEPAAGTDAGAGGATA